MLIYVTLWFNYVLFYGLIVIFISIYRQYPFIHLSKLIRSHLYLHVPYTKHLGITARTVPHGQRGSSARMPLNCLSCSVANQWRPQGTGALEISHRTCPFWIHSKKYVNSKNVCLYSGTLGPRIPAIFRVQLYTTVLCSLVVSKNNAIHISMVLSMLFAVYLWPSQNG